MQCGAGRFNPARGSISASACAECRLGSISPETGASECIACQANTFPHPNRIVCRQCQTLGCTGTPDCVVGYEGDLCSTCAPGFFVDATKGQSLYSCTPCGAAPAWALIVLTVVLLLIGVAFLKLNTSALFQKALVPLRSAATYFHGESLRRLSRYSEYYFVKYTSRVHLDALLALMMDTCTDCNMSWSN